MKSRKNAKKKKNYPALIVSLKVPKTLTVYLFFLFYTKTSKNTSLERFVILHITELRSAAKALKKYERRYIVDSMNIIIYKKNICRYFCTCINR